MTRSKRRTEFGSGSKTLVSGREYRYARAIPSLKTQGGKEIGRSVRWRHRTTLNYRQALSGKEVSINANRSKNWEGGKCHGKGRTFFLSERDQGFTFRKSNLSMSQITWKGGDERTEGDASIRKYREGRKGELGININTSRREPPV